jgi:hypothetical protein
MNWVHISIPLLDGCRPYSDLTEFLPLFSAPQQRLTSFPGVNHVQRGPAAYPPNRDPDFLDALFDDSGAISMPLQRNANPFSRVGRAFHEGAPMGSARARSRSIKPNFVKETPQASYREMDPQTSQIQKITNPDKKSANIFFICGCLIPLI